MANKVISYDGRLIPRAKELRSEMTPQECKLWYVFLRHYSVKFYRQKALRFFVVDFYCPRAKLAIELDGRQHDTEQGKLYDQERSAVLEECGVEVLRFSNSEVDKAFSFVCDKIRQAVQRRIAEIEE